ncbi:MAG: DUF1517 domain-containing protein [Cyanobacteria bacterium J06643_4]
MSKLFYRKQVRRSIIAILTSIFIAVGTGSYSPHVSFAPSLNRQHLHLHIGWHQAHALATSGGRASGGSFGSSSESGSSSGGSSSGGSSGSSSGGSSYNYSDDSSSDSYSSGGSNSQSDAIIGIFILLLFGGGLLVALLVKIQELIERLRHPQAYRRQQAQIRSKLAIYKEVEQQYEEQTNTIVTVTQVQVALRASAREVQERFNEISTEYDWGTPAGLHEALQETALTLLRSPEAWTHVSTTSKTILTRERAKQYFDTLSMEERSKFAVESLVNVGGNVRRRTISTKDDGPADYIVATLIVGTADDQPLFETIHTAEELSRVLKQLGAIALNYLMVYEMLWSPQDSSDSLTYEELLLNYPHMLQIC